MDTSHQVTLVNCHTVPSICWVDVLLLRLTYSVIWEIMLRIVKNKEQNSTFEYMALVRYVLTSL